MGTPITTIRNLGPVMAQACAEVGIDSAEALRALGSDAAYGRLLANGLRPHFIQYYVLEMGLQGRPWNDCKGAEKAALRARFDALKAAHPASDDAAFEAVLNEIGVVARKPSLGDRRAADRSALPRVSDQAVAAQPTSSRPEK